VRIVEVEGIGPAYAAKLEAVGVKTSEDLLDRGAKPAGRKKLAEETGINEKLILEWVNHADLMRIPGVGAEYSDLLEAAGVDSPAELARRNAANLAATFQELNAARGTVRRIPSPAMVDEWIEAAQKLPKVVEH
jgi:predicted flap endonuclease-1-like 5' DNA nuclease